MRNTQDTGLVQLFIAYCTLNLIANVRSRFERVTGKIIMKLWQALVVSILLPCYPDRPSESVCNKRFRTHAVMSKPDSKAWLLTADGCYSVMLCLTGRQGLDGILSTVMNRQHYAYRITADRSRYHPQCANQCQLSKYTSRQIR